ncbi:Gag-Pol polyprotein, partial [Mucuna pruriens]
MNKITPWFADICNFIVASKFHQKHIDYTKRNLKVMLNIIYGMIHTFGDSTMTKSFAGAFQTSRSSRSSTFAIQHLEAPTIFRDAHQFVSACKRCQGAGMAIRPFPVYNGYSYILLAINYVLRWIEAIATKTNDAKVVVDFLKSNIFYRFDVLKALISYQGSHFYNRSMSSLLKKYEVVHQIATAYHPQTNGQAEVFNREIKKILQKMANPSRKDWSRLLEDALWVHRTAYRTLLGTSPYQIVFGKACLLLVEIEHRAY